MKRSSALQLAAAACVAGVSTLGCPAKERSSTAERVPAEEGSPANDLLTNLANEDDGVVRITTGTEHFGKGLVTLSVFGNGKLEIVNLRAGKTTTYDGTLTKAQVEQLASSFTKAGFTKLRTSGPPRSPGDTPVVLELRRGDKQLYRGELWHGDRYQQPGLDHILKRNDAIVTETTKGELPY